GLWGVVAWTGWSGGRGRRTRAWRSSYPGFLPPLTVPVSRWLVARFEPQRAAVVDGYFLAGLYRRRDDQIERLSGVVAIDTRARPVRVVAQRKQTQSQRTAAIAVGVAVPMKVVVENNSPIEHGTLGRRQDDDRRRLDQGSRGYRLPGEQPAAASGVRSDFYEVVGYRQDAVESRRIGHSRGDPTVTSQARACARQLERRQPLQRR